ncbi:TPA: hypothetical protein N0F65_011009 [Lagenidium giganteum]|uniref:Uncharacterized protein n=1 Tax=Lagenidium giganteum TaxID=4803 RepID=A0AAV2ZA74_9STRA|nr:TPA: hypothetical protein N0F65_011009 [Lagenidium giganteum]
MATLALLLQSDLTKSRRGVGINNRVVYLVPYVGVVCRDCFFRTYELSVSTLTRLRREIEDGSFSPALHRGRGNTNKRQIDVPWLMEWFLDFAKTVGDVAPVRVRRCERSDVKSIRYTHTEQYTFLPAHVTWRTLHDELKRHIVSEALDVRLPAQDTFRKILKKRYPRVRIRSPRSNVCDTCAIYKGTMSAQATSDETELFGQHTAHARIMRKEHKRNQELSCDDYAVLTMDSLKP